LYLISKLSRLLVYDIGYSFSLSVEPFFIYTLPRGSICLLTAKDAVGSIIKCRREEPLLHGRRGSCHPGML